jgi:hypothetical protein
MLENHVFPQIDDMEKDDEFHSRSTGRGAAALQSQCAQDFEC